MTIVVILITILFDADNYDDGYNEYNTGHNNGHRCLSHSLPSIELTTNGLLL